MLLTLGKLLASPLSGDCRNGNDDACARISANVPGLKLETTLRHLSIYRSPNRRLDFRSAVAFKFGAELSRIPSHLFVNVDVLLLFLARVATFIRKT